MTFAQIKIKLCQALLFFIKAFFVVFVLTTMLKIGPILEGKLYPVITPTSAPQVIFEKDYMLVSFSAEKSRSCDIKNISVLSKIDGKFVQTEITFLEMGKESNMPDPRPLGLQFFGPWKIHAKATALIIVSTHMCHPFWNTESILVNWDNVK